MTLGCGIWLALQVRRRTRSYEKILGIDLSKKMIEEAQKRNSGNQIEYRISGLEEYDYPWKNEWGLCYI